LFSEETVASADKAFQRYINALKNLEKVAWVWMGLSIISTLLVLIDMIRQSNSPWYVVAIWSIGCFFLGVFGLMVYWLSFRRPLKGNHTVPTPLMALGSAALSAVGYTFAFFVIMLLVGLLARNANLGPLAILIPFLVSLMLFRIPMMGFMYGHKYWTAFRKYILPELASAIVGIVCLIFVNQYVGDFFSQYSRYIGAPADIFFWAQFSVYAVALTIVIYLLHLLMIHMRAKLWSAEMPKAIT
jgi:hypothetical protein